jgi:hypothetical protein
MDDGYKSELKAAIVASPSFQAGLQAAHGLARSSDEKKEMVEAVNNLHYASLDFLVAFISVEKAQAYSFDQIRIATTATFHKMMSVSMSCAL